MNDLDLQRLEESDLSLLETLDHVLNRGLVIAGEVTISVANVDLLFVGLNVLLGSVETMRENLGKRNRLEESGEAGTPRTSAARSLEREGT